MTARLLLAAVLAAAPCAVLSQESAAARDLAASCAQCHGTQGRSVSSEVLPLAGLPKERIVSQMKAFKEGTRPATVMHQLAKGYTDQQIDQIAGYFAAQKR
ncbi:MAG: c-type cytochrome [Burkholderiales bacterium]